MLILVPREIVRAIDVSPVECFWDILRLEHFPAVGRVLDLSVLELGLADAAALPPGSQERRGRNAVGLGVVLGLGHLIDSLVVVGVILLLFGGLMPLLLSPSVLGRGPSAARLDCQVVHTLADAEEAVLAPV